MSVFRGSIVEYPGVIVDHFATRNTVTGRAFFLSHCHRDHMSGLDSPELFMALKERDNKLFCSEVTKALLLQDPQFTKLADFLESLPMEEAVNMTLNHLQDQKAVNLTVTLLPAGHCPGSAMFLFQGENGNVLYTGDFRLTLEEVKHIAPLHINGRVLELQTIYLDTTFCHPKSTNIPSRDAARDTILDITKRWLKANPRNVVRLHCPTFGYEHILMAVAKQHNTRVHIARWRLNAYSALPAVADCLTGDGWTTRIHSCNFRKKQKKAAGLPCGALVENGQLPHVLTIKPSTQWFVASSLNGPSNSVVYIKPYNMYRVLHSMHASYSELCSFVRYLQPRTILPCVIPFTLGDTALTDLHSRLRGLLTASPTHTAITCSAFVSPIASDSSTSLSTRRTKNRKTWSSTVSTALGNDDSGDEGDDDDEEEEDEEDTDDELASSGEVNESRTISYMNMSPNVLSKPYVHLPSMLSTDLTGEANTHSSSSVIIEQPSCKVVSSCKLQQPILNVSLSNSSIDTVVDENETIPRQSPRVLADDCQHSDCSFSQDHLLPDTASASCHRSPRRRKAGEISPVDTCDTCDLVSVMNDIHKCKKRKIKDANELSLQHQHSSVDQTGEKPPVVVTYGDNVGTNASDVVRIHEQFSNHSVIDLTQDDNECEEEKEEEEEEEDEEEEEEEEERESMSLTKSMSGSPPFLASPSFFPPTPGKEESQSILMRQSIGFM